MHPSFEESTCHDIQRELLQAFVWGLNWLGHHWLYLIQVPFLILIFFIFIQGFFLDVGLFLNKIETIRLGNIMRPCYIIHFQLCCAALLELPRSPLLSSSVALQDSSFPTQSFTFPFLFYCTQIWCNLYLTMHYHFQGQIFFCNHNYVIILYYTYFKCQNPSPRTNQI